MEHRKYITDKEILRTTKDLLTIESHKEAPDRESKLVEYIKNLLETESISVETKEIETNRPNIYGTIEGKEEGIELIFNGHTDTVPGLDNMDYPPFTPFLKEGAIHGRGASDVKCAIAGMLSAMIAIKRSGYDLKKSVMFAGVIDEEERSKGTEQMVKDKILSKYVVLGEPTNLRVGVAHKGMEWIEVSFKGLGTHGSRPYMGINAVYMASEFNRLIYEELEPKVLKRKDNLLGPGSINVGKIVGGSDPNVVPSSCSVQIDRRWLPEESLDFIYDEIEDIAKKASKKFGGDYEIRPMRELTASMKNRPHYLDPNDQFVKDALDIVEEVTGVWDTPRDFQAWSDAGILSNHTDSKCIILGPANINQAHSNDDFCTVDELFKATEIYYKLIKKLCM